MDKLVFEVKKNLWHALRVYYQSVCYLQETKDSRLDTLMKKGINDVFDYTSEEDMVLMLGYETGESRSVYLSRINERLRAAIGAYQDLKTKHKHEEIKMNKYNNEQLDKLMLDVCEYIFML